VIARPFPAFCHGPNAFPPLIILAYLDLRRHGKAIIAAGRFAMDSG
jgi:hypothetical protein